jgi:hypothetical protein
MTRIALALALLTYAAAAVSTQPASPRAAPKELYAAPSIVPASFKVCDGLLRLKKLKGRTYATMAQEVTAAGKRQWVTACAPSATGLARSYRGSASRAPLEEKVSAVATYTP